MTGPMLDAALSYAGRGWAVFPCRGKLPALSGGRGFHDATTDAGQIRGWWTRMPTANIGVATGAVSGLAVLDVDPAHGGWESLCALEQRVGVLPPPLTQMTGGGGLHLVYAHPGTKVACGSNVFGPGLDVRGDGGYIVVAPSVHPGTGDLYRWPGGRSDWPLTPWPTVLHREPAAGPSAPCPAVSRGHLAPPGAARARLAGLVATVLGAVEGERNSRLHWAAARGGEMVAAGEVTRDTVTAVLHAAGREVGLTERETAATVASGMRAGMGRVAA